MVAQLTLRNRESHGIGMVAWDGKGWHGMAWDSMVWTEIVPN